MLMLIRIGGAGGVKRLFGIEGNGPLVGDQIALPPGTPGAAVRNVTARQWAIRSADGEGGNSTTQSNNLSFVLVIDTD